MTVIAAYEYTCRFCESVQNVFVSLQIANRAANAASLGNHKEAKAIILSE